MWLTPGCQSRDPDYAKPIESGITASQVSYFNPSTERARFALRVLEQADHVRK